MPESVRRSREMVQTVQEIGVRGQEVSGQHGRPLPPPAKTITAPTNGYRCREGFYPLVGGGAERGGFRDNGHSELSDSLEVDPSQRRGRSETASGSRP